MVTAVCASLVTDYSNGTTYLELCDCVLVLLLFWLLGVFAYRALHWNVDHFLIVTDYCKDEFSMARFIVTFLSFLFFLVFHFCLVEELQRNLRNFVDLGVVASVLHEKPSPASVTTSGANNYDNYIFRFLSNFPMHIYLHTFVNSQFTTRF